MSQEAFPSKITRPSTTRSNKIIETMLTCLHFAQDNSHMHNKQAHNTKSYNNPLYVHSLSFGNNFKKLAKAGSSIIHKSLLISD